MDNTRHEKQNTLKTGFPKIKLKICRKSVALLLFIFNSNIFIFNRNLNILRALGIILRSF